MAELNANLADLFAEHKDGTSGMTPTGLLTFAADCNLLGKGLKGKDLTMIFSQVKVGKKDELNFDRFQEVSCPISVAVLPHRPSHGHSGGA